MTLISSPLIRMRPPRAWWQRAKSKGQRVAVIGDRYPLPAVASRRSQRASGTHPRRQDPLPLALGSLRARERRAAPALDPGNGREREGAVEDDGHAEVRADRLLALDEVGAVGVRHLELDAAPQRQL